MGTAKLTRAALTPATLSSRVADSVGVGLRGRLRRGALQAGGEGLPLPFVDPDGPCECSVWRRRRGSLVATMTLRGS